MCVLGDSRAAGSACRAIACILWALETFSYFQAHQEGRSNVCEYVEVLDQKQTNLCYRHVEVDQTHHAILTQACVGV
jgi:hypothetical protein